MMQVKRPGGVMRFACNLAALRAVPRLMPRCPGTAGAIPGIYEVACA
jgi:hypothetical protein